MIDLTNARVITGAINIDFLGVLGVFPFLLFDHLLEYFESP